MTKEEVVTKVGRPYKSGFFYNNDDQLVDEFYFKELIYKNYTVYEVITLLTFLDNKLIGNQLVSDVELDRDSHRH